MWWPCWTASCPSWPVAWPSTWTAGHAGWGWRRARSARAAAGHGPGAASAAARRRDGQKELTRLERQLGKISGQEAELIKALAEHATDYPRLIELGAELRAVQEEKAALEERWLTVAEELSE